MISPPNRATIIEKLLSHGKQVDKTYIFAAINLLDSYFMEHKTEDLADSYMAALTALSIIVEQKPNIAIDFKERL